MFNRNNLKFYTYELFPKVNMDMNHNFSRILGNTFAILYYRDDKYLHFYTKTPIIANSLKQYFDLKETNLPAFNYYAKVTLKKEKDFYEDIQLADLHSFLAELEPDQGLLSWIKLEPVLNELHFLRLNKLNKLQQYSEKHKLMAQRLKEKAKERLYLIDLYLLDNDRDRLKQLTKIFQAYIPARLSFSIPLFKQDVTKIYEKPPKLSMIMSRFNEKKWFHVGESNLNHIIIIPNPNLLPTAVGRGSPLPDVAPQRNGPRIGVTESGKEVRIELEDMKRHTYIVGMTGAGKTTLLKTLIMRMKPYAFSILIDPHGDVSEELSGEAEYYFDAYIPNFGVNPLALPKLGDTPEDRLRAIDLAIAQNLEIFEKLFKLPENAPYVRYILEVILRYLYSKYDNVTFADLYNIITALMNNEIELDIDDKEFQKDLELLKNMNDTSFLSVLARISPYANNYVLRKMTSRNTIDWFKIVEKGKLAIFKIQKGALGSGVGFLAMSAIIMSIFFFSFLRARLGMERIPIIIYIDEFQNIADLESIQTILSESRKFGVHLILAHQYEKQLQPELLDAVLSNTGLKFIMKVQGTDAQRFAKLDPGFEEELKETLPNLPVGTAVLFLTPRPGEISVPIKVKIDLLETKGGGKPSKGFEPVGEERDIRTQLVPLLKYLEEQPKVAEQVVLFHIWKNKDHQMYQADLLRDLGVDRDYLKKILAELQSNGMINIEKSGNKVLVNYVRGLFRIKGIVSNKEGKKIALKTLVDYMKKGYVVVRGKQEGEIRPDFVAIKYDKNTFKPIYNEAIAIEIESPNEIEAHPEQVRRNMQKYLPIQNLFKEIHIWTSEDKFEKLKEIYNNFMNDNSITQEYKNKVKIFSVKLKQKETENANVQRETPEITVNNIKSEEMAEKKEILTGIQREVTGNTKIQTTNENANTETNSVKPGSLQEQGKNGLMEVEIDGSKYFVKSEDYTKLQMILKGNYRIEGNKIRAKILNSVWEVELISKEHDAVQEH